ncbi:hypothetical protein PDPUS_2_01086 [Photobacterium damselae subsp. piscicida]|uniref:YtxH domain-containing protein n=1 Tax=Photobacterium damsela subsp. piscicida TaxID=38294 RepID=A0A1V1VCW9_PHODP|nr:hypothetical protein [Photobacterium damselae]MBE8127411.1 hypothetical protein [Photobacterium damselae subsp. piscicida]MDP2556638.1 hypothetical protein [Photobacterium damselae subsp. piscicida]MDP2567474.1 hypothetical protein [Photobacterium damselae subsp. piscicida]PSV56875.1 hypothetical protein CTT35_15920 [Photobacterium damselae]PSW75986.1 hypothetical protein CTT37_16520 [Photobacterium damselae]
MKKQISVLALSLAAVFSAAVFAGNGLDATMDKAAMDAKQDAHAAMKDASADSKDAMTDIKDELNKGTEDVMKMAEKEGNAESHAINKHSDIMKIDQNAMKEEAATQVQEKVIKEVTN